MTLRKYRRRSPTVSAVEVSLQALREIERIPGCTVAASPMGDGVRVHVETHQGMRVAEPGDFITVDQHGSLKTMGPEEFHRMYEPQAHD